MKKAFKSIETTPSNDARKNLRTLNNYLTEASKCQDLSISTSAIEMLRDWKNIKKRIAPKKDKESGTKNNNNYYGEVRITQPRNSIININTEINKRSLENADDASSGYKTLHSLSKEKNNIPMRI